MNNLIDRQAAVDLADAMWEATHDRNIHELWSKLKDLPPAQPEPLTDIEQRIFLAAMAREEKVCKEIDAEWTSELEKISLVRVCREIERKVKKALFT